MFNRRQKYCSKNGEKDQGQGSVSTEEEQVYSPRKYIKKKVFKEKSQLCWKFMENGQCPYQLKCKFAHGTHQLTKSLTVNMKYKTKECLAYFNNVECHFGIRCNFSHMKKDYIMDSKWSQSKKNYRDIFYELKGQSRICIKQGSQI